MDLKQRQPVQPQKGHYLHPQVYSAGSESGSESDSAWIAGEGYLIFHYLPGGTPRLFLVECLVGRDDNEAGGGEDRPGGGEEDGESSRGGMGCLGTGVEAGASRGGYHDVQAF